MPVSRRTATAKMAATTPAAPQQTTSSESNIGELFRKFMHEEEERERLIEEQLAEKARLLAESEYRHFVAGFRWSAKSNRWRWWNGLTLTVFSHEGGYRYCIAADGGRKKFSTTTYATDDEAFRSLWEDLQCL